MVDHRAAIELVRHPRLNELGAFVVDQRGVVVFLVRCGHYVAVAVVAGARDEAERVGFGEPPVAAVVGVLDRVVVRVGGGVLARVHHGDDVADVVVGIGQHVVGGIGDRDEPVGLVVGVPGDVVVRVTRGEVTEWFGLREQVADPVIHVARGAGRSGRGVLGRGHGRGPVGQVVHSSGSRTVGRRGLGDVVVGVVDRWRADDELAGGLVLRYPALQWTVERVVAVGAGLAARVDNVGHVAANVVLHPREVVQRVRGGLREAGGVVVGERGRATVGVDGGPRLAELIVGVDRLEIVRHARCGNTLWVGDGGEVAAVVVAELPAPSLRRGLGRQLGDVPVQRALVAKHGGGRVVGDRLRVPNRYGVTGLLVIGPGGHRTVGLGQGHHVVITIPGKAGVLVAGVGDPRPPPEPVGVVTGGVAFRIRDRGVHFGPLRPVRIDVAEPDRATHSVGDGLWLPLVFRVDRGGVVGQACRAAARIPDGDQFDVLIALFGVVVEVEWFGLAAAGAVDQIGEQSLVAVCKGQGTT